MVPYIEDYLMNTMKILDSLYGDIHIGQLVHELVALRTCHGRLFIIGLGGNSAHAIHAAADFRHLCQIEAYAPDNLAELTATANDVGWETIFVEWLSASGLSQDDMLFVLSVGGGSERDNVSRPMIAAIDYARGVGATTGGIVGRDGGYTARQVDICIVVPTVDPATVTPQTEGVQSVLLHLLVSHPELQRNQAKWESLTT